jgi:hypothetical protein
MGSIARRRTEGILLLFRVSANDASEPIPLESTAHEFFNRLLEHAPNRDSVSAG